MTPASQPLGTRPPNKEPPPSLPVNTIKGPALPSESVSLAGKPGTGSGCSPTSWQSNRSLQWASSSSSKKSLGKCPRVLAWAAPTPAFPPSQAVSQCPALAVIPCLARAPTQEDSGKQTFWPPHLTFPCVLGALPQLFPEMAKSPEGRLPLGEGALHVPDSLRAQNWPRGHLKLLPAPAPCPLTRMSVDRATRALPVGPPARAHPGINYQVLWRQPMPSP